MFLQRLLFCHVSIRLSIGNNVQGCAKTAHADAIRIGCKDNSHRDIVTDIIHQRVRR